MLRLTLAAGHYDRTEALRDGRVRAEGIDLTYIMLRVEEIFRSDEGGAMRVRSLLLLSANPFDESAQRGVVESQMTGNFHLTITVFMDHF
jgi:hypothetical protein